MSNFQTLLANFFCSACPRLCLNPVYWNTCLSLQAHFWNMSPASDYPMLQPVANYYFLMLRSGKSWIPAISTLCVSCLNWICYSSVLCKHFNSVVNMDLLSGLSICLWNYGLWSIAWCILPLSLSWHLGKGYSGEETLFYTVLVSGTNHILYSGCPSLV